jgi:hypothetical protein
VRRDNQHPLQPDSCDDQTWGRPCEIVLIGGLRIASASQKRGSQWLSLLVTKFPLCATKGSGFTKSTNVDVTVNKW